MSTGYSWEGIRQVRATLLGARHVPERLCGGRVYLERYIKCSTFKCSTFDLLQVWVCVRLIVIHGTAMTGNNQWQVTINLTHTITWRNASVLRRRTTEFCWQTTTNIWTHAWYDCAPTQHTQPCHRPVTGIKCCATLCRILVKGQKSFEHSLLWCRNMINKARTGLPVDSSLWGKLCMTNMEHPKFEGHVMPNEDKY